MTSHIFFWGVGEGKFPILSFSTCRPSLVFCQPRITNSSSVTITSMYLILLGWGGVSHSHLVHLGGEHKLGLENRCLACKPTSGGFYIWKVPDFTSLTIAHPRGLDFITCCLQDTPHSEIPPVLQLLSFSNWILLSKLFILKLFKIHMPL